MGDLQLRADLDRDEDNRPVVLTAEEKLALLDAIDVVVSAIREDLGAHAENCDDDICSRCGGDVRAGAIRLLLTLRMAETKLVRSASVLPGPG